MCFWEGNNKIGIKLIYLEIIYVRGLLSFDLIGVFMDIDIFIER